MGWAEVARESEEKVLSRARVEAHDFFDMLWDARRGGWMRRSEAYVWLAEQMKLPIEWVHIGMFDVEQCRRVVRLAAQAYLDHWRG